MNTVSVVIPTFNCGPYIAEAVSSALNQTVAPVEVIVIDDGSTDDTGSILKDFSQQIVYLRQPNAGVSIARNAGTKTACGTWLLFLDADDRLKPAAIANLLSVAGDRTDCVVYGDKHRIAHDGTHMDYVQSRDCTGLPPSAARACYGGAPFEPGAAIVPKWLTDEIGGFERTHSPCEDRHFWIRCGALVEFLHAPQVVLDYRVRPVSASKNRVRQVTNSVRTRIDLLPWFRARGIRVFERDPEPATLLGDDLKSVYWTREWQVVDSLLDLAAEYNLDSPSIRDVRRRRRYPEWLIRMKDKVDNFRSRPLS